MRNVLITYYHTCALLIFINVSILFSERYLFPPRGKRGDERKLIYESQGLVRKFEGFRRFREMRVNHGRTFRNMAFRVDDESRAKNKKQSEANTPFD